MNVGLVGTGNMGKPMAMNLLKAGFKLSIYARHKNAVQDLVDLGARLVDSPKEVAQASDVIITCLPGPDDLRQVMLGNNGILAGAKKGDTIVCMDTMGPLVVKEMAHIAKSKGVGVIDAPVSGGVEGAKNGALTIMIGGDTDTVQKHMAVFQALGKRIFHVGDVGAGNAVKLVNQMINMTNLIATLEGFVLGAKAGVNPQVLYDVLHVSSANNFAMERKIPNYVLKGNFEPGFKISLAKKDIDLALRMANELSLPVLVGSVVGQIFEYSKGRGLGDKDESAIITLLEEIAEKKVRTPA
jgi:3-hydroxyisobutyrate dehydrogenase-like beta-hydroxyacid dehydrogenase